MSDEGLRRVTTLRLTERQFQDLEAIARVEGTNTSSLMREATEALIAVRCADPEFRERVRARIDEDQELLRRLEGDQ